MLKVVHAYTFDMLSLEAHAYKSSLLLFAKCPLDLLNCYYAFSYVSKIAYRLKTMGDYNAMQGKAYIKHTTQT